MAWIEEREGLVRVRLRIQPKASRNAVVAEPDGRIRVCLTAPPVEGEANRSLVAFLAKILGTPRRAVTLLSGDHSRDKTVGIAGLPMDEVKDRLLGPSKGNAN